MLALLPVTISIHALREESDWRYRTNTLGEYNFNPRSPRGERHDKAAEQLINDDFNPRSPRGERHVNKTASAVLFFNFNPRSPRGERPKAKDKVKNFVVISIHALREESDTCVGD